MTRDQITICRGGRVRRGFTLTELLVVVGIVFILMSLLIIGLTRGLNTAKAAAAQSLLNSIGVGIESFRKDLEFEPPLVTPQLEGSGRVGLTTPESYNAANPGVFNSVNEILERDDVRYHSEYTIAAYLLGIGDFTNDGIENLGLNPNAAAGTDDWKQDGQAGLGIKSPGRSKAWKQVSAGTWTHEPQTQGRTFGPYLDGVSLGGDGRRQSKILDLDEDRGLYRIIDPWGNAVRYYKGWPVLGANNEPNVERIPMPIRRWESVSLEYELRLAGIEANPGGDADVVGASRAVMGAPYALVSAGGSADDWVMENKFKSGDPIEPMPPFGELLSAPERPSLLCPDSRSLDGMQDDYAEALERMLESNVRYTP